MTLTPNGNVGIGVTNPDIKLMLLLTPPASQQMVIYVIHLDYVNTNYQSFHGLRGIMIIIALR